MYMTWTSGIFVSQKSRPRKAQGRESLWRTHGDQGVGVRLPDNLADGEGVDLADKV
jgi:hypothetical protein